MTEQEWLAATDPWTMVEVLRDKASERKLRLFACGCVRRHWHALTHAQSRQAIEISEQYADGLVPDEARHDAWDEANNVPLNQPCLEQAAIYAIESGDFSDECIDIALDVVDEVAHWNDIQEGGTEISERIAHCCLLRCILGNPFRTVPVDTAWHTATVVAIARGIYDDRAFDRLPVLADALMDAGCEVPDVLDHCHGDGPHVRGCWVVDAVLGKT
jgi:hypothetical protein